MTYFVTYKIDSRYIVEVEAHSLDEALLKANEEYVDADFGDITDVVDSAVIFVEDEDGKCVLEK